MYSVMLEIVLIDNKSLLYILFKVYKFIIIFDKDKLFKGKDGKVNVFFFFEFDFGLFGLQFYDDFGEVSQNVFKF